ncbi:hydrogen peroxide-inducible genes activator [Antarcticimicrobium luteum]|uniref:Hydrogen peroxide-inducible genes activator n=1 Tax=Antarcticimicrobium luteum TaxID=2547397 RepID=A0A4R5UZY0_9RHOB|nr:hydrogen peroxide-inducible genes activator [Antarcticimicrobium luteum]TDK44964.1 hydrogen peroxide-inducible genes activator [Antarcticimicrobium luteum]
MNFTLRQLTYFKALTQHRNFGRAAEVCNVSQPALSVQIKALEAAMGAPLVERRARDVVLTGLGRQVLARADEVLSAAGRLDRLARDHSGGRSLSLGVIPTLAPYLLPGVLAALRAGDLSLTVQVREARTERLLAALQAGELDTVILALPTGMRGVVERPLFEDRFLLAGSRSRLARMDAAGQVLRPTDLQPSQLLLLEDGHCLTDQALEVCGMDRNSGNINMGASSLATLSRLVGAGFGLTLMPELAAAAEQAADPDLALRRFPAPEPARQIGLVRRDSTPAEDWFDRLAGMIRGVGEGIVASYRNENGPAQGGPDDGAADPGDQAAASFDVSVR